MDEITVAKKIIKELYDMGLDASLEHPGVIFGGHDDTWFIAGFANGHLDVDLYEEPHLETMLGSTSSSLTIKEKPRVLAAFILGAYNAQCC